MSRKATIRCRARDLVLAVDNFTSQATKAARLKRTPVWVDSEDLTNFDNFHYTLDNEVLFVSVEIVEYVFIAAIEPNKTNPRKL